jgi:putative effector of murein hydrolase
MSGKIKKYIHPVISSAGLIFLSLGMLATISNLSIETVLNSYYGNGLNGGGDIISSMLGPSVICFGLQLFQYRSLLMNNLWVIFSSTFFSAWFGLLSSSIMSNIAFLQPKQIAFSTLTRCITSPLALAGAQLTGADPSLSALIVIITGIIGASVGEAILKICGVDDPLSIGLSMGASAHGLGTAALAHDPVKFSSAVVAMTLTGLWTVLILTFDPVKEKLLNIALK